MPRMKRVQKSVSILMAVLMVMISTPVSSVFAAMIGTEALLVNPDTSGARDQLRSFFDRKDVQSELTARGIDPDEAKARVDSLRGIDPDEAKARVDSLSDAEVMQLADKIGALPAGGDAGGTLLFIAIIVLLTLLVLEITGYTDFI